jgi:tetratricopeptide (TPR) repeat protein
MIVRLYNCCIIQLFLTRVAAMAAVAMVLFTFLAVSAQAQSDSLFDKANREYAAGDFKEAITDYEVLVQKRDYSANLFYDLGNAYFRTQDFGKAILNYERALALDRHHAEARANLGVARDEARALELQTGTAERWLRFASANQFAVAGAIAFWVFVCLGAYLVFARRRGPGAIVLATFALLVFAVAAYEAHATDRMNGANAIVTGKDVQARVATADTANSVLALPAGSEIRVVSKRGDWIYAALPNNLRGWIPANSAEPVRL